MLTPGLRSVFGWFWLAVYVIVPPLLIFLVIRQARRAAPLPPPELPLSPPILRAIPLV